MMNLFARNPRSSISDAQPSRISSEELAGQFLQVNDSVYELHRPADVPTMQILFFPGVSFEDDSDAMLSTWLSEDGSSIWPQTWLVEDFPDAHVLAVSYNSEEMQASVGVLDVFTLVEKIMSDVLRARVGQVRDCPVVLIGHSVGGVVIKSLCALLEERKPLYSERSLLDNIRGIFCYSTPRRWSAALERLSMQSFNLTPMMQCLKELNIKAKRGHARFEDITTRYNWEVAGLGETAPTEVGSFNGIIVPAASARMGDSFHRVGGADHFSITRPRTKLSRSYCYLTSFLQNIQAQKNRKMGGNSNVQYLPRNITIKDSQLLEILRKFETSTIVGLVGLGGSGKTTLAKAVFNAMLPQFEYSCFVSNDTTLRGNFIARNAVWKCMHYHGRKVSEEEAWSQLKGKSLLLCFDDVSDGNKLLLELVNLSSSDSRFIVTSRDQGLLRHLVQDFYKVPLLHDKSSRELFVRLAFLNPSSVPLKLSPLVNAFVKKCEGLPLALDCCGRYLRGKEYEDVWRETLIALNGFAGSRLNELWVTLRIAYDILSFAEQQMFLDAATFFSINGDWTLGNAKQVWKKAYNTDVVSLHWRRLVDLFLVDDVEEEDNVKVHAVLRSLGHRLADEPGNQGKRRNATEWLRLLRQADNVDKLDVLARLIAEDHVSKDAPHTRTKMYRRLNKKRDMKLSIPITIDGGKGLEDISALGGLNTSKHLVITKFSGSLLPGNMYQLVDLQQLEFQDCLHLKELPEWQGLGQHRNLERLVLMSCPSLSGVPESIGSLRALRHLRIQDCEGLKDLPGTLGLLCGLEQLIIWNCSGLTEIPNTIGQLGALQHLLIHGCEGLKSLPQSLGELEGLEHLVVSNCPHLTEITSLPIWSLKHLRIQDCESLQILLETIKQVDALEYVTISNCSNVSTFLTAYGEELLDARAPPAHGHPSRSAAEQLSTSLESFLAALGTEGPNSYLVSTEWLLDLESYEKDVLSSICIEKGFGLTYQTTSNTYYDRYRKHVQNISTGSDVPTTDVTDRFCRPGDNATSSGVSQTSGDLLPDKLQSLQIEEGVDIRGSPGVLNSTQQGMKSDDFQTCVPKSLQVDCSASEDMLPSEVSFRKHLVTKKFGDCSVTFPNHIDLRISTLVEKNVRMPFYKFSVGKEIVREYASLRVFVETTVSCCLKSDDNPKKVHIEISKIRGEMKYVDTAEPRNHDLFLQCVRTNVGAGIANGDRYECIPLRFSEAVGGAKLSRSGINPNMSGPGSTTVELNCPVERGRQVRGDQALLFEDEDHPATLEGIVKTSLSHESILEMDIRYQLGLTTEEPCEPMPTRDRPFCGIIPTFPVIDFGCIIEIKTRDLLVSLF